MMKLFFATVLLMSSSVLAHERHFSNDSCDVDLHQNITINKKEIKVADSNHSLYRILSNNTLIIDDKEMSLTNQQQQDVANFSLQIRQVVPEVKHLAINAVDLAIDGVNMAFNELLGKENKVSADLTKELTQVRDDIDSKFDSEQGIAINGSSDDIFDEDFEQRLESALEKTIKNSIGSLMIALGKQILFSGGDEDALEAKMDNFSQQLEQTMEHRSSKLEQQAQAVCLKLQQIDLLEENLKATIPSFPKVDVITVEVETNNKI